jgi:hypothetical protein
VATAELELALQFFLQGEGSFMRKHPNHAFFLMPDNVIFLLF